jgi:hypothetical protein
VKRFLGTPLIDYLPAFALLVIAIAYLATGYSYTPQARAFPVSVAWATIVLVALDITSRTHTALGETLTRLFNPAASAGHDEKRPAYPAWKQISAVLWATGFVVLILLIGFLYAIPIYVFASTYFRGRKRLLLCLLVSAGVTLFIWLLFTQVLKLELYPGVLFSEF